MIATVIPNIELCNQPVIMITSTLLWDEKKKAPLSHTSIVKK